MMPSGFWVLSWIGFCKFGDVRDVRDAWRGGATWRGVIHPSGGHDDVVGHRRVLLVARHAVGIHHGDETGSVLVGARVRGRRAVACGRAGGWRERGTEPVRERALVSHRARAAAAAWGGYRTLLSKAGSSHLAWEARCTKDDGQKDETQRTVLL